MGGAYVTRLIQRNMVFGAVYLFHEVGMRQARHFRYYAFEYTEGESHFHSLEEMPCGCSSSQTGDRLLAHRLLKTKVSIPLSRYGIITYILYLITYI